MSKELDRWQHEYRQKTEDLEKERKITEEALEPLKLQKLDIDEQIKDTISKINVLKVTSTLLPAFVLPYAHSSLLLARSPRFQRMTSKLKLFYRA